MSNHITKLIEVELVLKLIEVGTSYGHLVASVLTLPHNHGFWLDRFNGGGWYTTMMSLLYLQMNFVPTFRLIYQGGNGSDTKIQNA